MRGLGDSGGDHEFYAEVDAFIASLPDDSERVQRIADRLPEDFHEVLRRRGGGSPAGASPGYALPTAPVWNWGVIAASVAIAAALVGMGLIWLSGEVADPTPGEPLARPAGEGDEMEFIVTIHSDGEAEMVAQPRREDGADGAAKLAGRDPEALDGGAVRASIADVAAEPWYLTAPTSPPVPDVADPAWSRSAIDRFVIAALQEHGIRPVADADRLTLLRRLSYHLTGLPPSPELVEHFLHNQSPAAYGSVVEELMAKWQFGEHWASRWLELAGYDPGDPELWRYREYVIAAFNEDKPYDRFLAEQLAGDLLHVPDVAERTEANIGTGFIAAAGAGEVRPDQVADRVANVFMGVDPQAARAGDGSPMSGRDWRAMAGIFASTRIDRGLDLRLNPKRFPPANLVEDDRLRSEAKRFRGLMASAERRLERAVARRERERARRLRAEVARLRSQLMAVEVVRRDQVVSSGSKFTGAGERPDPVEFGGVPRGLPAGFSPAPMPVPELAGVGSGRLELAQWLLDPRHPLTARVMVDRLWSELFGHGLLGATGGHGLAAEPPLHPELLDFLAVRFSSDGWSVKRLVREMVMSRAYQLSAVEGAGALAGRQWGQGSRDLTAQELRDAVLSVAGWLKPDAGWEHRMFTRAEFGVIADLEDERAYRSLYLDDAPVVDEELVFQAALAASRRTLATGGSGDPADLVRGVFINTLAREPSSEESAWAVEVIGRAGSLEDGGVLGSVVRPDRLGEQAAYLEGLLPRVTVRLEAGYRSGDRIVSRAMLYHALMRTEEFRRLR